ncbi:hypothetical protein [Acinetobacter bereziniae]
MENEKAWGNLDFLLFDHFLLFVQGISDLGMGSFVKVIQLRQSM